MTLKSLKEEIFDTMLDAVRDAIYGHYHSAAVQVNTVDGYINLVSVEGGEVAASVIHDSRKARKCARLEAFCENVIKAIKWCDVRREIESDEAVTLEQEYAHRGEMIFAPSMRWHRI